jgi:hypothetical protein
LKKSFQNLRQVSNQDRNLPSVYPALSSINPAESIYQGAKSLTEQASFFDDKRNQAKIKNGLQQVDNFLNTEYAESEYAGGFMLSSLGVNE